MSGTELRAGYRRDARWVAGCLALVVCVAFAPFLLGRVTLLASAWDAPSLYATGASAQPPPDRPLKELDPGGAAWQSEAWLQIEHDAIFVDHRVPWWDPYDGYGHPFAAAQAQQPFFPLTVLAAIHPSPLVWNAYVVLRLYLAGVFAALFVLLYGGRAAGLAAGVAASFAGYYVLYYSMPHMSVETLLPALLWATELLVRRPGFGTAALAGTVIGLLHLGGMPESAAVAVLAASLYLVVRIRFLPSPTVPFARIGTFAAANLLGAAIGAIMLIPFAEYLPHALDMHRTSAAPVGLGVDGSSLGRALFQRLVPLSYGPPLNSILEPAPAWNQIRGWFGAAAGALALLALLDLTRRRAERLPATGAIVALGVVAVCALAKSLGAVWINWVGALPVLRLIIFPKYGEVPLDIALALLCGFGVAAFENGRRPERWVPIAAVAAVTLVLTAGFVEALGAVPPTTGLRYLYFGVALAAAALVAALFVANVPRAAPCAAAVLAAVVGLDVIGNYYVPMYAGIAAIPPAARNAYRGAPYLDALRAATGGRRAIGVGGPMWPEWGGALRIDTPEALNAIYPQRYLSFVNAFLTRRNATAPEDLVDRFDASADPSLATAAAHRWMTLSSVAAIVAPAGRTLGDPHLRKVYDRDVTIYAYDDPLPRASIFHAVRPAATDDDALRILADPATDVHRVLVLSAGATAPEVQPAAPGESARIAARDVTSVTIDAHLGARGLVMLNDMDHPGWRASVDGVATPILRADYLFRAVPVAAGAHRIRFEYASAGDALGTAVTIAGLLLTAGLGLFARRRSRAAAI